MKKTIFKLDEELSIMILSGIAMLFSFLSTYSPIGGLVSFVFVFLKSFIFFIVPFIIYMLEKHSLRLKKVASIYSGYFIIDLIATIFVSISFVNGMVPLLLKTIFDLINLIILLSSLFIFVEQLLLYSDIESKVYSNTIMYVVYLLGNFVSYPFISFVNKKINKKSSQD